MVDPSWEQARLIPVSGISGPDEQERRGVSALLATLESVREFGRGITTPLGAPAGAMNCFIEVHFVSGERKLRPDGVIRVVRGGRPWTALVEVKTGRNDLTVPQVESYLDVAREQGFDAVLTISNQIVALGGDHPVSVDRRKCRKVELHHLSWSQIHTEAEIERVNRSVADPDQAWILAELIRYLEHPRSGAVDFDDMGPSWVTVRDCVVKRTLRASDEAAPDVVTRFGQLVAFAGMRLSRTLGVQVGPVQARDVTSPLQGGVTELVEAGILRGSLKVPNTAAPFAIAADLRAGRVTCAITVEAPGEGRQTTRVNWLLRQLTEAPPDLLIAATVARSRTPGPHTSLGAAREEPRLLVEDAKRDIRSFTLTLGHVAGSKRGQGRGSFVSSVLGLTDTFYSQVVQPLKPWSASAPKPRSAKPLPGEPPTGTIAGELPIKDAVSTQPLLASPAEGSPGEEYIAAPWPLPPGRSPTQQTDGLASQDGLDERV
jgi:hypothetical protein